VHLLVTLAPAEYSREIRASISGTVTDRTGAAVANATVTVTNPATNASVVARTNDVGQYLAPFLAPGTYQLAVEAAGFKRYVQTGIRLQTLDKLRVDMALQVGEVGTNDFHGSVFEYFQNAKMNANPFELNAAGPIASQSQGLSLKDQVLFANLNGQSRGSYNPDMNNFAPRISNPTIAKWFDTSKWIDPATGKLVTAQPSYTFRTYLYYFSDVRSPAYKNWDVSVTKYFPIYERMKLQFRFEAVNAFNHPWFTGLASGGTDVTNAAFGRLNPVQNNLPRFLKLGLNLQW